MTWHYRPCRKIDVDGKPYYIIVEYYTADHGHVAWTEEPSYPVGETRAELIRDLKLMLHDVQNRRTLILKKKSVKKRGKVCSSK